MAKWSQRFDTPILTRSKTLATLADARAYALAMDPGEANRVEWQRAVELMLAAAEGGDVAAARKQLFFALLMSNDVEWTGK